MDAFANKTDFHDMQSAEVRFGGDVLLKRRAERTSERKSQRGEE
jgi:hypothetical protein